MTDKLHEFDPQPIQYLRSEYIRRIGERLIGYPHLHGWKVVKYEESILFNSRDGKRRLKVNSDLLFTIDAIHAVDHVRSNAFQCRNLDEVWKLCSATLEAYKQ